MARKERVIKLYVDDIRACPDGWELARTITTAIRILATMPVDEISLDHDIVCECCMGQIEMIGQHLVSETFEPVARYIALMPKRPIVHFHTSNPHGEARMAMILDDR